MLLTAEADVNIRNKIGETALMVAAQSDHDDCVDTLTQTVTDVNLQNKKGHSATKISTQSCNQKGADLVRWAGDRKKGGRGKKCSVS